MGEIFQEGKSICFSFQTSIDCFMISSPFKMKVKPMTEPQNVKLSGPGLSKSIPASVPTEFTIDATNAGYGSPEVVIQVNHTEINFQIFRHRY